MRMPMKKLFVVFAFFIVAACSGNRGVDWIDISFKEALELGKAQNRPILVDFYSPT